MSALKSIIEVSVTVSLILCSAAFAQSPAEISCKTCHTRSPQKSGYREALDSSIHRDMDCTDCHTSISLDEIDPTSPRSHGGEVPPVSCGDCHEDEGERYIKHGRLRVGTDPDIPRCSECHGTHDIRPVSDELSRVHPNNLPATCMACHTNVNLIKDHHILRGEPIKLYEGSIHGRAINGQSRVAATCIDCHSPQSESEQPSAHRILSPTDPESSVNHFKVPTTCGRCHKTVAEDYLAGVHGQLVLRGDQDAPVCTHCHGEHGILPVSDMRSPVSAARLTQATCAPCHESVALNERFGVAAGKLPSYVDSYHGYKRKGSDVHVANCSSCHGAHRILPHTDKNSSIHPDNLQYTCGECHPGISSVMANSSIHGPGLGEVYGWPQLIAKVYKWLIVMTIGFMLIHNFAHWLRHTKLRAKGDCVVRMTAGEVTQHWVLMLSFTVLVLTGFSLRFSDAWWVQMLFGWGGGAGFLIRGTIHRVAAVVFIICGCWHVLYLCTKPGRSWLRDMMGSTRDLLDMYNHVLFFLGLRSKPPSFRRFSYMEKLEYWALIWGSGVMALTGIILSYENFFTERWNLSKVILDVSQVIHYYEAWLATLAILVWHIYATVFSPSVYPMNPAWLKGEMPKDMYEEEHPAAPGLEATADKTRPQSDDANPD